MFTTLELKVMEQIVLNELTQLNGSMPDKNTSPRDCITWVNCVEDAGEVQGKQLSGVMSQLVQKGLIFSEGKGRDAVCGPTEKGLKLFLKAKGVK